jgi:oxygen-independent coproporphyrinogen-3 oxidase
MAQIFSLNSDLLSKYNINGPRYTSYPTALEFSEQFDNQEFEFAIKHSSSNALSLYIHIPFCHSICYYCGCNKIVTRHKHKADIYLDYLVKEIVARAELFQQHKIQQIHFGGGTPSFLSKEQFSRVISAIKQHFEFQQDVQMSIEIDPREIELDLLDHLKNLGFNRLSFGFQDANLEVQEAINRVQDSDFVKQLIIRGRSLGFQSINLDVIYGLPHQRLELFDNTLGKVIELNPDRISLFSYAHMPSRFAAQRKIKDEWLPNASDKSDLMLEAIDTLTDAGYVAIGMDHFAKPNDELAIAQQQGNLHRNFQGYTTQGDCDLLGLGVSSISSVGRSFSQNYKDLSDYYNAIDTSSHAVDKGLLLNQDDVIRGEVIKQLMCNFKLNKNSINRQFNIDFDDYFAFEISKLTTYVKDRLIDIDDNEITIKPIAKLLIRNICMTFDVYLQKQLNNQRFSRVI